jgi:hypothetical protein
VVWCVVTTHERAALTRRLSQRSKEICGRVSAKYLFAGVHFFRGHEVAAKIRIGRQIFKRAGLVPQIQEIGLGKNALVQALQWRGSIDRDQTIRLRIGKTAQKDLIQDAEHRRVGTHPERQDDYGT